MLIVCVCASGSRDDDTQSMPDVRRREFHNHHLNQNQHGAQPKLNQEKQDKWSTISTTETQVEQWKHNHLTKWMDLFKEAQEHTIVCRKMFIYKLPNTAVSVHCYSIKNRKQGLKWLKIISTKTKAGLMNARAKS